MFHENLIQLRKLHGMSQEQLAEKLDVSRQTVSKWENGDSAPDLLQSRKLAEIFDISIDELVQESPAAPLAPAPKGKHVFGCVKVGDKGQIVIPARARRIFGIQPGDSLIVLGDEAQGLAILKADSFLTLADEIRRKMQAEE